MKILTKKQYDKLYKSIYDEVRSLNCVENNKHYYIPIYSQVRNTYTPKYIHNGEWARIHNMIEQGLMFDKIYEKSICQYCGKESKDQLRKDNTIN